MSRQNSVWTKVEIGKKHFKGKHKDKLKIIVRKLKNWTLIIHKEKCLLIFFHDYFPSLKQTIFRMGLAAYGMRQWQKAIDSFEQLNNEFPNNKDAEKDLKRAKQRLVEEKTGRFDFKAMHIECAMQEKREMDVADYKGAIEIADIPGKGNFGLS